MIVSALLLALAAQAELPPAAPAPGQLVCASEGGARVAQISLPAGTRIISGRLRRTRAREGDFRLQILLTDGAVRHYAGIDAIAGPPPPNGPHISDRAIAHFGRHSMTPDFEYARRPDGGRHFAFPLIETFDFTLEIHGDALSVAIAWPEAGGRESSAGIVPLHGVRPDRLIVYCRNDDFAVEGLSFR